MGSWQETKREKIANNRYGNSTALNNGSYDSAISSSPVSSISQSSDTSGVSSRESPQPVKYSASQIKQEKLFENGVDIDDTDLNLQSTPVLCDGVYQHRLDILRKDKS